MKFGETGNMLSKRGQGQFTECKPDTSHSKHLKKAEDTNCIANRENIDPNI